MLVIRFRRIGKKNKPTYRLTVAEHTKPVNGSFVSDVGFYNPHTKIAGLKGDEILEWLKKGAKPSNTVARLLQREKIKHNSVVVVKKNKKAKTKDTKVDKPAAPAAAPTETAAEEATDITTSETQELETPEVVEEDSTETTEETAESDEPTSAEEKPK